MPGDHHALCRRVVVASHVCWIVGIYSSSIITDWPHQTHTSSPSVSARITTISQNEHHPVIVLVFFDHFPVIADQLLSNSNANMAFVNGSVKNVLIVLSTVS